MTQRPESVRDLPTVPHLDLDAQIALAEQAVIRRDARVRRRATTLVRRVKTDTVRHAGGGLLIAAGAILATWWFKHRRAASAPPTPAPAADAPAASPSTGEKIAVEAGLSLAALLPLVWPYMPHSVRRAVTPGTASTVLSFITPMLGRLFRRKQQQAS